MKTNMEIYSRLDMETYSQLKQDLHIVTFFDSKKDLYFVDIGAYDGKTFSNTYLLEKTYNWRGICCEPLEEAYEKLIKVRTSTCIKKAIFSKSNLNLNFSNAEMGSGITHYIDAHVKNKLKPQTEVSTLTFDDLLHQNNSPHHIHFLSLDTEGTEFEILKSVNLNKYTFGYICLEHNWIEPKRTEMRTFLQNNGYIYRTMNSCDDDYFHESIINNTFYLNNDKSKQVYLSLNNNVVNIKSNFFSFFQEENGEGIFDARFLIITWKTLGRGRLFYDKIKYQNGDIWHREL